MFVAVGGTGVDDDQAGTPRGCTQGEAKSERAAEGVAAEERTLVAEVVEQLKDAADGAFRTVEDGVFGGIGIAMAEQFDGNNREVLAQAREVGFERGLAGGEAVDQDERGRTIRVRVQLVPNPLTGRSE